MRHQDIPAPTIQRLSLYLRQLELLKSNGIDTVSSKKLGDVLGLTDAQVRKDLGHFGQFGKPGIGYGVEGLIQGVRHILGTDRTWAVGCSSPFSTTKIESRPCRRRIAALGTMTAVASLCSARCS